jgi:hypothetical protein
MARTVWGAHKRYMDTYLNVYKGYYVSHTSSYLASLTNFHSLLVMELDVITRVITGFEAVLMTLLTSAVIVSPLPKSKLLSSSTTPLLKQLLSVSTMSLPVKLSMLSLLSRRAMRSMINSRKSSFSKSERALVPSLLQRLSTSFRICQRLEVVRS